MGHVLTEEQDKAFQEVQKMVTEAPILSYYDLSSPLAIQFDASQKGFKVLLSFRIRNQWHTLAVPSPTPKDDTPIQRRC